MLKRTLTGAVILLLVAGFIALRLVSPLFFDAFVLVLSYGALIEMFMAYKVAGKKFYKSIVSLVPILAWGVFKFTNSPLIWLVLLILAVFICSMLFEVWLAGAKPQDDGVNNINAVAEKLLDTTKTTVIVSVYPTILIGFMFGLNYLGLNLGFIAIIMVFATSMLTDVFAYCFGMLFGQKGGRKLAPSISPKKSAIGSFFGVVGGVIAGVLGWVLFYKLGIFDALSGLTLTKSIVLFGVIGLVGGFLTQMGDLVASALKRMIGIKDYGNVLPGHGGFMDRLDGQMFVSVLVYILFTLLI